MHTIQLNNTATLNLGGVLKATELTLLHTQGLCLTRILADIITRKDSFAVKFDKEKMTVRRKFFLQTLNCFS